GGFDAAFLDGNLHGHPVDPVASALRAAGIPFVFVSGYGRESLPAAFADTEIVGKPFSSEDVLCAAAALLDEHARAGLVPARTAASGQEETALRGRDAIAAPLPLEPARIVWDKRPAAPAWRRRPLYDQGKRCCALWISARGRACSRRCSAWPCSCSWASASVC